MAALYDIANDYAKLMADDLDPELIADTLEGLEGELCDKAEQTLAVIKNKKMLADALKDEAASLNARSKAINNQIDRLKQYIVDSMNTAELKKLNAGLHVITIKKPSKKLVVDDPATLPPNFVDIETIFKPRTQDIKNYLNSGEKIDGARMEDAKAGILIK